MIIADIPVQFFYKNASVWALFIAGFIILIVNRYVKKDENSLPIFFTALGGIIFSLLSSLSLVQNILTTSVDDSNFIENLSNISVVFINLSLLLLTFIIFSKKILERGKFLESNLSQELFFLLFSGIGANIAATASNLIGLLAGIFVIFTVLFSSFYVQSQHLSANSVDHQNKVNDKFWLFSISVLLGIVFLIFGIVIFTKSTDSISISHVVNSENKIMSEISFIFCWLSLIIFAGIIPFSRWVNRISNQQNLLFTAKIQVLNRVLFFFLLLKFVFLFQQLQIVRSFLTVTALLLIILSILMLLAEKRIRLFFDLILSAQLGFGLLIGFEILTNCGNGLINVIFFTAAYILSSSGVYIFLIKNADKENLADLSGLHQKQPWIAMFFTLLIFTLTGLPLTAMLKSRWDVIFVLTAQKSYFIALVSIISSVILIFVCTKTIARMFHPAKMDLTSEAKICTSNNWILNFVTVLITFLLIAIGISSIFFIAF